MGKEQDWKNLGEQILDSVAGALNTGDFSQLNNLVSDTVNNAVQEAKKQADSERAQREDFIRSAQLNRESREKWLQQQEEIRRRQEERREEWRNRHLEQLEREYAQHRENQKNEAQAENGAGAKKNGKKKGTEIKFREVGSVANVLNTVFGAIGMGVFAAFSIVALILIFAEGGVAAIVWTILAAVAGFLSTGMLVRGGKQRELLRRAKEYIKICGEKLYADVTTLAAQTGRSTRAVRKDIKKMLKCGMFPEGHLDEQETTFMLNNEVYRRYTETAEAYKMREQMEQQRIAEENRPKTPEELAMEEQKRQEEALASMVSQGSDYVKRLRELNDMIPGEEISSQLFQLESLLKQIFDRVREHPEQMGRMQKLMDYYLPTTVKLVEAYVEFEKVETPGPDIKDAKAEIQRTLGIINEAFVELLNNLFQDAVFDATTDAQVLQTMLAREGLRREMSAEPVAAQQQDSIPSAGDAMAVPQDSETAQALKAPWES